MDKNTFRLHLENLHILLEFRESTKGPWSQPKLIKEYNKSSYKRTLWFQICWCPSMGESIKCWLIYVDTAYYTSWGNWKHVKITHVINTSANSGLRALQNKTICIKTMFNRNRLHAFLFFFLSPTTIVQCFILSRGVPKEMLSRYTLEEHIEKL